jgi:hypothetical protein
LQIVKKRKCLVLTTFFYITDPDWQPTAGVSSTYVFVWLVMVTFWRRQFGSRRFDGDNFEVDIWTCGISEVINICNVAPFFLAASSASRFPNRTTRTRSPTFYILVYRFRGVETRQMAPTVLFERDICSIRLLFDPTFVRPNICLNDLFEQLVRTTLVRSDICLTDFCSNDFCSTRLVWSNFCLTRYLFYSTFVRPNVCSTQCLFDPMFVCPYFCSTRRWTWLKFVFSRH